ncbi:hypothetical protein AXF42_Ash014973 [Apostasia shenzhenica]|uniref:Kinetochore protein SPC25 n=1 Tax=Apostasia shenzhenica TaxID=1088818 RepID=A0A2I0B2S0_9ASPA|nr:hypothetical protein AXF42_Ash014973 [Apostasia shenzhenica]
MLSSLEGMPEMTAEESTRRKMAQLRMACELEIRACRERSVVLANSIRQSINSIMPLHDKTLANRGSLGKLKEHLKELEAHFHETLKVKASKEAQRTAITEAISAVDVRIEHLQKIVHGQRGKRDEYKAVLKEQLLALEKIEEKNKEDVVESEKIQEVVAWYKRVLGFQIEGGDGVKFIFNKVDSKNPDKEYSFVARLDGDKYTLLNCDPQLEDTDELVEELNRTNGFYKFVKVMREKFLEVARKGSAADSDSSFSLSSPTPTSVESRTEPLTHEDPCLQQKNKQLVSRRKVVSTEEQFYLHN